MFIRLEYDNDLRKTLWSVKEILHSDFSKEEIIEKSNDVRNNFKEKPVNLINKVSVELPLIEDEKFWEEFKNDTLPTLKNSKVIKCLHVGHNPKIMNGKVLEIFCRQIARLFGYLLECPVVLLEVDMVSYIDLVKNNKKTQVLWDFRDHEFVCMLDQTAWNCEFGGKHELIFTTLKSMSRDLQPLEQQNEIKPKINRTINIAETLRKNREAAKLLKE